MPEHTFSTGPDWFVLFGAPMQSGKFDGCVFRDAADIGITNANGHAWFFTRCRRRYVSHASAPDADIVVLGPTFVQLRGILERSGTDLKQMRKLLRVFTESSFTVIARSGESIHVSSSVFGSVPLFYAAMSSRNGAIVGVSDRARLIAETNRDETATDLTHIVDQSALAGRLTEPIPQPLIDRSMWSNVCSTRTGHSLELGPGATVAEVQWWTPPEPARKVNGTESRVISDAISKSVELQIRHQPHVASDLSGGFDSSAITAYAHRHRPTSSGVSRIRAVTVTNSDPLHEDEGWAQVVADHLPNIRRTLIGSHHVPTNYANLHETSFELNEPSIVMCQRSRIRSLVSTDAESEFEVHLSGHGGDDLFTGVSAMAADYLRVSPREAVSHVRNYIGLYGWPLLQSLAQVVRPQSFRGWLQTSVTHNDVSLRSPSFTWGFPSKLHPWMTPKAVEIIRSSLHEAANEIPLAQQPGRHRYIRNLHDSARTARALADISATDGPRLVSPYLDDRVVNAVLSAPTQLLCDPTRFKPLLAGAVQHILPAQLLTRITKDDGSNNDAVGQSRFRSQLTELWNDSRLAEMGLVEPDTLITATQRPVSSGISSGHLMPTVSCELWLRSLEHSPSFKRRRTKEGDGCDYHYSLETV